MRRASPTGTGTPAEPGRRWTATGIAGAAAGAGRKMSPSPAVPSKHLSLKDDGRSRLAPVRTGGGPKCEPQSPLEGFDVAVDRVFVRGGKEVGRETMKTRHTPRDRVTCGA
ncbi:hypothetical protein ACFWWM_34420 [Streptomyces sp. NPDC058682]|uniref:hypothetical protein n=1 Tax=Streptomyces sp. NPDC058682 TaxID=3346596 RepID=UPI003664BEDB